MLGQLVAGQSWAMPATINRLKKIPCTDIAFRCYPVDIDTYFHMNNAAYLRVAELCRWYVDRQLV